MQAMQKRITTELDPEIEKMGFDKMRSRIAIRLERWTRVEGWADERYRGGPENPLSDADLEAKVRSCCDGILHEKVQLKLIDAGTVDYATDRRQQVDANHERRRRMSRRRMATIAAPKRCSQKPNNFDKRCMTEQSASNAKVSNYYYKGGPAPFPKKGVCSSPRQKH